MARDTVPCSSDGIRSQNETLNSTHSNGPDTADVSNHVIIHQPATPPATEHQRVSAASAASAAGAVLRRASTEPHTAAVKLSLQDISRTAPHARRPPELLTSPPRAQTWRNSSSGAHA
ncbi:hypothetical protein E2562_010191 [Oryza meyeriana var. granulata]|uniref:Uncharacterized protein n=1 Tax=Oryza meyeriana var. granulata TaxID=110450 RepID=A0A6G1EJG7_9ORYZ|nr:hypothetical protein E2562_010191 [Oryza meyeriana var. granulata]